MVKIERDVRKELILETFDSKPWRSVCWLAQAFGCSRQYISKLLLTERAERYRKLRHPSRGRRTDLRR